LSKVITPGLVIACFVSGLGLFIGPGLSSPLLFPWVIGYLFLSLRVSYDAYVFPSPLKPFPFIVLGIVLLNFLVQVTGGVLSSLWPVYFLYAVVVAAFSPPRRAYGMVAVILAIESANLFLTGQDLAGRWPIYAGSGLSLAGVSAAASHIMYRIRSEADQAKDAVKRMEEKADAVDPLAKPAKLEALMPHSRQAANLRTARDREANFADLLDMMFLIIPVHAYVLFVKERREGTEMFVLRACRTESKGEIVHVGTALDPAAGKTGIDLCAERFKSQYLPELSGESVHFLGYYIRDVKNSPVRSAMIIPILSKNGDSVVAVLAADNVATDSFSAETQEIMKRFSGFFLEVIENTQLSLDLKTRADHFGALHAISTDLNESLKFSEIMAKIIPQIKSVVPFDFCACLLKTDKEGKNLLELTALDGYAREMVGRTFPIEDSAVISFMLKHWKENGTTTFYTRDYGDRGKDIGLFPFRELQKPIQSLYGRLLVANDDINGVLFLSSLRPDTFSEYNRNYLLDTLMNQVAMVANNSLLHRKIEDQAMTDGLTGLLNHRTFMGKLAEKYRELERTPRPFSILLMDIDKFKLVNDKYGHPVGDVAIKTVARILHETIRGSDFVARYGGEEFAAGMVETDIRGAEQMAERVRSIMEKTMITRVHDGELRCTLSIGVVSFPQDTEKMADLVNMADEALYYAKRSGRNRVCLYRDSLKNPAEPVQS
jgi:two-component system, cell cycle response regulator